MTDGPIFEPKGADGIAPGPAPSGSVFLGHLLWPHGSILSSLWVHPPCARPATGGPRKLSVPGRVHSKPKSSGSQEAGKPPGSNPFLTRDTVESPAKWLCVAWSKIWARATASNQTKGLLCPTPLLVDGCSQNFVQLFFMFMLFFMFINLFTRAAAPNQGAQGSSSNPPPGWRRLSKFNPFFSPPVPETFVSHRTSLAPP